MLEIAYSATNLGDLILHLPENGLRHQVEVDGTWYEWVDPRLLGRKPSEPNNPNSHTRLLELKPSVAFEKQQITINEGWFEIPDGKEEAYANRRHTGLFSSTDIGWSVDAGDYGEELMLKPGVHKVRVAVICPSARAIQGHGVTRSVSQAVEVEVVAREMEEKTPEESISESCREHLRTLPASYRLSALANALPHDHMRGVQVLWQGNEALAFLAMEEGLDRIPHDDILWSFDLRKTDGRWRATSVGQIPDADAYSAIPMKFRSRHPDASGWGASLPSQVSEKLLTTVHPDYRKILGKWSLVSIEAKGEVPDFEFHGIRGDSEPGAECDFPALQTPVGLLRMPDDENAVLLDGVFRIAELDPTKKPKEIRSPRWAANLFLYCDGIYRFEENGDLTLCLYARYGINPGQEVPKDFELEDEKDQVLIRLRRP